MIRNGFIKDVNGDWYSMSIVEIIAVSAMIEDTQDRNLRYEIVCHFGLLEEYGRIVIEDGFESEKEANKYLYRIMQGEI